MKARDFDDALEIANGTEYGLTGSVFSRDGCWL
jgi:1-pyrroline-5-carboxylate dehydrogenase